MEVGEVSSNIQYFEYQGITLNNEQRAALQTSLPIVRDQYQFKRIYFWGKILGIREDYFIAKGVGKNELKKRTFLYSHDCLRWKLLNPPTEDHLIKLDLCKGRFTGDPTHEFECKKYKMVGTGDEERIEESATMLKEEDRLSAVVQKIEEDTFIVPRGAFIKSPTNQVLRNRLFEGLSVNEAAKTSNYVHFREAQLLKEKPLLYLANLDRAIDFLDCIDEDQPKNCWSLQFERGSTLALLKSLKWPGAVAFHIPETRNFGNIYFGTGEINKDLSFML